jgi:hypothetical protein
LSRAGDDGGNAAASCEMQAEGRRKARSFAGSRAVAESPDRALQTRKFHDVF